MPTVHLFAKYPTPGRVKTRLIPALGEDGAAALHRRLTERAVHQMRASGLDFDMRITGAKRTAFSDWLGDDVTLVDQGDGGLGERLGRVPAPAILIGADIPDLTARHIRDAADALEHAPVAIGPAEDGGYYLIAYREPSPFLWEDMPWGTDAVFGETMRRLEAHGIAPHLLEPLADCDRPEDLARWPGLTV